MITLVETITLTASATNITFSNIPQTGRSLMVKISWKGTGGSFIFRCKPNNVLIDSGAGATLNHVNGGVGFNNAFQLGWMDGDTSTTNAFHTATVMIPDYTSSQVKTLIANGRTINYSTSSFSYNTLLSTGETANGNAISSLVFVGDSGNLLANTTASLYLID